MNEFRQGPRFGAHDGVSERRHAIVAAPFVVTWPCRLFSYNLLEDSSLREKQYSLLCEAQPFMQIYWS
jgi:hypothetical protein